MPCQDDRTIDQRMEGMLRGNQMNFNSSNPINSSTSQKTKNALPPSTNCHCQRPPFSLSTPTLSLQIKLKPHCSRTPTLDHTVELRGIRTVTAGKLRCKECDSWILSIYL